jgi:NAD(P)-dependent dehydrogenase (short-subunit alcohol dehydrogenase family)
MSATRPFAIITGASTGIGFELAKRCAKEGYDLLIVADEPEIEKVAASLRGEGAEVKALQADRRPKACIRFMRRRTGVRSTPCWRMPGAVSATGFSTRTSEGAAGHRYQYHRHDLSDP